MSTTRQEKAATDSAAATAGGAWRLDFGARPLPGGGTLFRLWAPLSDRVAVKVVAPFEQTFEMERGDGDVFEARAEGVGPGADYFYLVGGERELPDPVSRHQPQGVHGPSRVVAPDEFRWTNEGWRGPALKEYVIYELHVGTFTPEGTFEAAAGKLAHLRSLGVTAVEVMPVAEFPGGRNWGYDGAYLYAPQSTYGGPEGLKKLVDACHREGLAFVLDVVYNHLGPEGNYLGEFAPIYSDVYKSPWGSALNFDGADSGGVRRFFIENALYWVTEYHVDALRLDAVHAIYDASPRHFLEELAAEFRAVGRALGREVYTIAESDLNDVRVIKPAGEGGYGIDAQWSDDFHHSLHGLLTGAANGYFADFGRMADLAKAVEEGFVYAGDYSNFRRRAHGTSSIGRPGEQFVISAQNHDQIANAYWGDRLGTLLDLERQKLAAALLLCGAPNVPMLFMGQEWGETAPFLYFTSHTDAALGEAVREGRKEEYRSFVREEGETVSALGGFADPQAPETFEQSKLLWSRLEESPHREMLNFYRDLLALRREHACLSNCDKTRTSVGFDEDRRWMTIERGDAGGSRAVLLCNFAGEAGEVPAPVAPEGGTWRLALWSGEEKYGGAGEGRPPETPGEGRGGSSVTLQPGGAVIYVSG
ncbi:MAG TPA: malto-oligosyltrehalose trehalohydrolase [Pyrinomonadaceae bacterium]|nr:malto-oligosyltrehalose trehalohydrolase [Pyrinomonadaceae bacterium]